MKNVWWNSNEMNIWYLQDKECIQISHEAIIFNEGLNELKLQSKFKLNV